MELPMVKVHQPQRDKLDQKQHPYPDEPLHEKGQYKNQDGLYHMWYNVHAANKQNP